MTTIALGSICGSPGATRLAIGLAAAWPEPRRRILVEADADGGPDRDVRLRELAGVQGGTDVHLARAERGLGNEHRRVD